MPEEFAHVGVLVPDDLFELRCILADIAVALGGAHSHADHVGQTTS